VLLLRFADDAEVPRDAAETEVRDWRGIGTAVIGSDACVRPGVAAALLGGLRQRFDHVVVTAPPTINSADGVALAAAVDTVVLIVRADETPAALAQSLVKSVRERSHDPIGAVLVGARDYGPRWLGRMLGSPLAEAR
jgi:hypothetical protein